MHDSDICITGAGVVTTLGTTVETLADNLLAGRSGIGPVTGFDVSQHPCRIGGQLSTIPCPAGWEAAMFAALDPQQQAALWCCASALRDAGWWERRHEVRIGLVLGLGAEWLTRWERDAHRGGRELFQNEIVGEGVAGWVSAELQLRGPSLILSAACASGNHAFGLGRRWLELGWVDVCLAGACDLNLTPMALAGFGNLRALSRRNETPQAASRPFDRGRDGFVMAEGGAVLVLEPAATARRRSARIRGLLAGCGSSSDAHHMVIPRPNPEPAATAMRQALTQACINPDEIDYINAHATSTPVGDVIEAQVLHTVLGTAARRVPVSSTKSMTGHLLAAAAAVEAVACLIAIERSAIPPTINLDDPDPACDLGHVANHTQARRVRVAVSNSFGFGGSNTCVVFRAA